MVGQSTSVSYADGDEPVHDTRHVIETDLDEQARGACDQLNNGLYDFHPWPTLRY